MKYLLGVAIGGVGEAGAILGYDPEWMEWITPLRDYTIRGSIREGEMAMLLTYLAENKLTCILKPMQEAV